MFMEPHCLDLNYVCVFCLLVAVMSLSDQSTSNTSKSQPINPSVITTTATTVPRTVPTAGLTLEPRQSKFQVFFTALPFPFKLLLA